jgi:hypothetical protein
MFSLQIKSGERATRFANHWQTLSLAGRYKRHRSFVDVVAATAQPKLDLQPDNRALFQAELCGDHRRIDADAIT